jgi:hypothetical protein
VSFLSRISAALSPEPITLAAAHRGYAQATAALQKPAPVVKQKPALSRVDLAGIVELVRSREALRIRRQYTAKDEAWKGIKSRQIGIRLRWSPADRERILSLCEAGDLFSLGMLLDAMRADPTVYGLMSKRTSLLRLPLQWQGDPLLIEQLKGVDPVYDPDTGALLDPGLGSDFQKMFPLDDLGAVFWDGELGGVGVGQFVPQPDGNLRLHHRDIHWLRFDWETGKWLYQSPIESYVVEGPLWFLYRPYGQSRPWSRAPWFACALPVIAKLDATLDRLRWQGDYADPTRVITIDKSQKPEDFDAVDAYLGEGVGRRQHFVLREGQDYKLVESTGRGFEVYTEAEKSADDAIAKALSGGQATTTQGINGWSKGSIYQDIDYSIIQASAEHLAEAIHEQGLKPYAQRWNRPPFIWCKWDIRPSEAKVAEADSYAKFAEAAQKVLVLNDLLKAEGKQIDFVGWTEQLGFSIPTKPLEPAVKPESNDIIDAEFEEDIPVELDEPENDDGYGGELT